MATNPDNIFLTFIILILAIGGAYWLNATNACSREGFDGNNTTTPQGTTAAQTTTPQGTTSSQTASQTAPQTTAPSIVLGEAITNQLSSITDTGIHNTVQKELIDLQTLVARYANLDVPIVMNDAGQVCSMWGDYANGRLRQQQNQCQSLDATRILKCLDATGTPSTCGNIMADGYITKKANINYQSMLDTATSKVINAIPGITTSVATMDANANNLIRSLADRGSIQLQQQDIIANNNENMAYKNKLMKDNTEKLAKKQNDTNINQNNFSSFMNKINDVDSATNIYYKIIIGLIIAIVIMGILNFLFSNVLA
jgi:hypothetical protein